MRNENIIIQITGRYNTVVTTDKEKYTEGIKPAISRSNKIIQLNTAPQKYLSYVLIFAKKF